MNLKNKHVLITGASRGIGESLAYSLHREGAKLSLVARMSNSLKMVAEKTEGKAYPADLSSIAEVSQLPQRIQDDSGPIDVLINNAGIAKPKRFFDYSDEEFETIMRVNLLSPILLTKAIVPSMIEKGFGHVVNISSVGGIVPMPGLAPYCSSKAGLAHFTACLRIELKGTPVKTTLAELASIKGGHTMEDFKTYQPTIRFDEISHKLKMTVDTPKEVVADKIVEALKKEKAHVRIPTRIAPYFMMAEFPRCVAEKTWQHYQPH